MISGPTVPHPRLLVADLLRSQGGIDRLGGVDHHFLESGLVFIEEDIEFGEGLRVDFLARDAAGAPVLILAVEDADAARIPLALLDLDHWFRKNAFLLRQGLGLVESAPPGLRWDLQHRIFLVTHGLRASHLERLEGLASLPLQVFELSFLALRGKRQWYARLLPAWQTRVHGHLPPVPTGLVDAHQADLVHHFLNRLGALSSGLEIHGDRYHRLILFEGRPCAELLCTDRDARLRIEGRDEERILLAVSDVEAALDQVLRLLLDRQAAEEDFPGLGQASLRDGDEDKAEEDEEAGGTRMAEPLDESDPVRSPRNGKATPASKAVPLRGRARMGVTTRQKMPEARDLGPKLTEEEIDAFLKP